MHHSDTNSKCVEHHQIGVGMGYGTITYEGKTVRWHRLVYCKHNNCTLDSIKGLIIRHTCDNPRCINPEHLTIGTQKDNMQDCVQRGRQIRGERHPSAKLTAADVDFIRTNYTPKHPTKNAKALTKQFGISLRSLYYILDGTNWGGDYSSQRVVI